MEHESLLSEKEQERLYLVHHMHHLKQMNKIYHELHHCFLFSEQNDKGKQYSIIHLLSGTKLYHIIKPSPPAILYDHANNSFAIKKVVLENKTYFTI